jgi:protease IV
MRDFLKYAAASALGTLVGLFTLIALLSMGAIGLISVLLASSNQETIPELEQKSMLTLDLSTDIVDAVPYSGAGALFEETLSGQSYQAVSLYSALKAIDAAIEDDKIAGIYLTGNTAESFATLKELRVALEAFKKSGKPIVAYTEGWGELDYYIGSVANTIYFNPAGMLEINGFRAEIQYLAGALQKYGIGVQVLRVGRYKSAVEPFIRQASSPEEKQQTQALLSDLWQDFLKTAGQDRKISAQKLQQIADGGGLLMADQAKAAGLVDKIAFYDQVLAQLQKLTDQSEENEDSFAQTSLHTYSRLVNERDQGFYAEDTIALVYAEGEIVMGSGIGPGYVTSDGLSSTLRDVKHNDNIKAVVLRVNSPGGSALASEIIAREVELLAKEKPVIISMGDYAASGGYMIAAPGAKIFATPTTITGSIGVYGLLLNFKDLANRNGVTWDTIKTAKYSDIDTISRPQTPDELKLQQDSVNDLYDRFISLVAKSRKVTKDRVNQVAQGRVWSGSDAVQANLVDEMGGLDAALRFAAKSAELEDWEVEEFPKPLSLEEQIIDSLLTQDGLMSHLSWRNNLVSQELNEFQEQLQVLPNLNDPNSLYMRLPFTTEIE